MALGEEKLVELPQGREPTRRGSRLQTVAFELQEVVPDAPRLDADRVVGLLGQEAEIIGEIAAIGLERVLGGTPLGGDHVEEEVTQRPRGGNLRQRRRHGLRASAD